jgi:hypothetical protein
MLLVLSLSVWADDASWQGALRDGSQITIDPVTNKVTRQWQGESRMLWDGVHQLENGAVIIIRDGVVVKDSVVLQAQQEQQRKELQEACMTLVRKVCGPRNECESHPACDPARQLLLMEDEELHGGSWPGSRPESSRQCLEALSNETFFQACSERGAGMPLSSCEQLQRRVCGKDRACAGSEACSAAGQLVKMEREDRYAPPGGATQAGEQCRGLLNDQGFFNSCGK